MSSRIKHLGLSLLLAGCLRSGYDDAGGDGGYVPGVTNVTDTPCQVSARALSWDEETKLGFAASHMRPYLDGMHSMSLLWTGGNSTAIELTLFDMKPFFVTERATPGYAASNGSTACSDHFRIDANALLNTADAALDYVERPISLRSYSSDEAFGELLLDTGTFAGTFAPAMLTYNCFRRLQVKVLLSEGGFSGSLAQLYSRGGCADGDGSTSKQLLAGHWGLRWQSY